MFCRDPGGAFRRRPLTKDPTDAAAFTGNIVWYPGDGGFYGGANDLLWHFDPATLTVKKLDIPGFTPPEWATSLTPGWSHKGELFFIVQREWDLQGIVQVGGGKATSIPLPSGWMGRTLKEEKALVVSEKLVTLVTNGGGPKSVLRIVR
ncbi:MAG: hypothetical protein HYV09_36095 [Deltaproteobacteria bacterium]|nr:hypothetical protein [Deltaproteobacteria bacterium]